MSKSFTLEQVNQMLPDVARKFALICEKRSVYLRVHDAIFVQELAQNADREKNTDLFAGDLEKDIQNLEETIFELSKEIDELISFGCIIRSMDQGLIDFPGELRGERVFFAWKSGEKQIAFYRKRNVSGASAERISLG